MIAVVYDVQPNMHTIAETEYLPKCIDHLSGERLKFPEQSILTLVLSVRTL